jgi:hypothetical protein
MPATSTKTMKPIGTAAIMSLPMLESSAGLPTITALPPETTTASPMKAICVPSVQRMGVMFSREIKRPLMTPPARPTSSAPAMKARLKAVPLSVADRKDETITAESTPERLASAMPERSMPPLPAHMASMTPMASRPISGTWLAMDWRLKTERNEPPEMRAPATSKRPLMTTSIASCPPVFCMDSSLLFTKQNPASLKR